jgi:hypothetical protein
MLTGVLLVGRYSFVVENALMVTIFSYLLIFKHTRGTTS